jgi:hypothetical protein
MVEGQNILFFVYLRNNPGWFRSDLFQRVQLQPNVAVFRKEKGPKRSKSNLHEDETEEKA